MRKSVSRFLLFSSVVIFSCSEEVATDVETEPTYDFIITTEPGYFALDKDAWIFLHDSDGRAVGEGQLVDGQTSKFRLKEDNVGITIVRVNTNIVNDLPTFQLETFLNVNAAATWTLKKDHIAPLNCGFTLGDVEIIVSDPAIAKNLNGCLATKELVHLPDRNTSIGTSMRFRPITITEKCNTAFLYVMDDNRVPHYKMLENLLPGQYAYNLSQLNNFDRVVDIIYKETSSALLVVTGFEANQSVYNTGYCTNFNFGDYLTSLPTSSMKVGYLDRFPKHVTHFSVSYPGYSMSYSEAGAVPSAITMPETLEATISDKTVGGYTFSVNEPIVYRQVSFSYFPQSSTAESGMTWMINSGPENDFKNLAVAPTQFLTKYPQFKIENLKHDQSYFYKSYQTIAQVVSQRFGDGARPETYKYVYKAYYN